MAQQKLAHYQIKELLGEGSFAWVHRAYDEKFEQDVALKLLKPMWLGDSQAVGRFKQEARTMRKLQHQNIVNVFDVGQSESQVYLSQRLVEGETLAQRLAQGPLTWEAMLKIVQDVASALDYAHGQGIIHRDIKPSNILLDTDNRAYIGDFGLVRAVEGSASLSASGSMVGTGHYMAPEVWDGKAASPATDVYALSCVVFEMLMGQVLFEGSSMAAVVKQHIMGPQFPEMWPGAVPEEVTEVLKAGLAEDPLQRISSTGELAARLAGLVINPPPPPRPGPPEPLSGIFQLGPITLPIPAWQGSLIPWIVTLVGVVAVLITIAIMVIFSAGESGNDSWAAVASKGTGITEQEWRWASSSDPPEKFVNEKLNEGFFITDIDFGNDSWAAVMSKGTGITEQEWRWASSSEAPQEFVNEKLNEGFFITDIDFGNDSWVAVMSKGTGMTEQQWHWASSSEAPEDFINVKLNEGFFITDIDFGNDSWVAVMSKGTGITEQQWRWASNSEAPEDFINKKLNEGFFITDIDFGNDSWVTVMSKGTGATEQEWHIRDDIPEDFINEKLNEGFFITSFE